MSTVFVTGATGVIGRATIPVLVAAGYKVRALSRSAANDVSIRALGATPVRGNLFDVDSLKQAIAGADAVMHLATRIPPSSKSRRKEAWADNDRIRDQGTRALVTAAKKTGVQTFIYPSFAAVYPDQGDAWIDAATTPVAPLWFVDSTIAAEEAVREFAGSDASGERRGIALRFGLLYGPDIPSIHEQLTLAKRGLSVFGGARDAFVPMLWIEDAASALLAALERAPTGVYDVVDDEPIRQGQLVPAMAAAVGRTRLLALPTWLLRLAAGDFGTALSRSLRISNRRFREATGWAPSVPNAIDGLARIAERDPVDASPRVPLAVRAGLWALFLFSLLAGIQQQFAPRFFYDNFPGFGMTWVSVDGPFNEHLLRDLGGANLALAVAIGYALTRPSAGLVRVIAAAVLVAQAPHFLYHLAHLDLLPTPLDRVLQTAALTLTLLIPVLVLLGAREIGQPETREPESRSLGEGGRQVSQTALLDSTPLVRASSAAHGR